MNNPSPLVPQGSMLEQKNKSRARVRLAVFCVLSIHAIGLMALLMQGCRKPQETDTTPAVDTNTAPLLDTTNVPEATNAYVPPPVDTNVVVPTPSATEYTVLKGDNFST